MQRIAGRARLVTAPHLARRLAAQLARQPPNRLRRGRLGPFHRLQAVREQRGHGDRVLVGIHPHPGDSVRGHDRPPSYAALTPQGVNPRSSVAASPPPSCLSFARARLNDRRPVVPYCLGSTNPASGCGSRRPRKWCCRTDRSRCSPGATTSVQGPPKEPPAFIRLVCEAHIPLPCMLLCALGPVAQTDRAAVS